MVLFFQMDNFDFKSNRTTDFRHHSKLFVTVKNENNLQNVLRAVQHLENVAAIVVKGVSWVSVDIIAQHHVVWRQGHIILTLTHCYW